MLITYDFVCSEKYMYVFTFLSSFFMISGQLYHAESFDYAPQKYTIWIAFLMKN